MFISLPVIIIMIVVFIGFQNTLNLIGNIFAFVVLGPLIFLMNVLLKIKGWL